MTDADRIAALETRVEALEDQVTILKEALGLTYRAPLGYGLSPFQSQVLGVIASTPVVTYERLMTALYGNRSDPPEVNTIKTVMCNMRKRLAAAGSPVTINTHWGIGYSLSEADRRRVLDCRIAA